VPFAFTDPEQRRLYRLLVTVGEGPADFFEDACRMLAAPDDLKATSHLVGHALREVESAVRDFATALADARAPALPAEESYTQACASSRAAAEIERCIRVLAIPNGATVAEAWKRLGLHRVAHRNRRDAPRGLDEGLDESWRGFMNVVGAVLDRATELYEQHLAGADALLALERPTGADVDRLRDDFPRNFAFRNHFFGKLTNPAWLPMLRSRGMLRSPPRPTLSADGTMLMRLPWPEAGYTARMAADPGLAREVRAVVEEAQHGDDAFAIHELAASLLRLPVVEVAALHRVVRAWAPLAAAYSPLTGRLVEIAARLAQSGHPDEGLDVVRAALALRRDPRADASVHQVEEPQGGVQAWQYSHLLRDHGPSFERATGVAWLTVVEDLLEEAIRRSVNPDERPGDVSSLEEALLHDARRKDEQDPHPRGARDGLLEELRRCVRSLVQADPTRLSAIVTGLWARPNKLFQVVALELLASEAGAATAVAREHLLRRGLLQDKDLGSEYRAMLEAVCPHLERMEVEALLALVDEGPDWAKAAKAKEETEDGHADDELFAGRTERWRRDLLGAMRAALDAGALERLRGLETEHGPARAAYETFNVEELRRVGGSPVPLEEARGWEPERLLEFARMWAPAERDPWVGGETPRDLADVIAKTVAQRPADYSVLAREWIGAPKTYVRGFLDGLRPQAGARPIVDWDAVMALATWVVDQPREVVGADASGFFEDPHWGWARMAVLRLLDAGLGAGTGGVDPGHRAAVWRIIETCLCDPEPEASEEKSRAGGMDYATRSINELRACAMHTAVRYGLWVLRGRGDGPFTSGFSEFVPELRAALDRHLDPSVERAPSVRAVYGWRLPLFWHVDRTWVGAARERILPGDAGDARLRDAAWVTYLICGGQPQSELANVLQGEYHAAIEELGKEAPARPQREDPRPGLVRHLVGFYLSGALNTGSGLLTSFYAIAPDELRAEAVRCLGHSLSADRECSREVLDRACAFWNWRVAAVRGTAEMSMRELAAFGTWLAAECLPPDWRVERGLEVLRLVGRLDPPWDAAEKLEGLFSAAPGGVLECLRLLVEGSEGTWDMHGWEEHGTAILRAGLSHVDAQVRDRAKGIVNRFLAMGFTTFRPLL
jgi:hypothetical protein